MEQQLDNIIVSYKENLISAAQRLIQKPSVLDENTADTGSPFGKEIRSALDEFIVIVKEMGFTVKDYDGYAAAVSFGEKKGNEIGVLAHLDVVPASGEWKFPPFDAVIDDGKLYGRGALDDKGPLAAALFAMKAVKESGLPIKNHVCMIVGCDEETAHRGLKYYLTREEAPGSGFSPDGNFPVIHGEKGILRFRISRKLKKTQKDRLSIDCMEAGTVINAVPDYAAARIQGEKTGLEYYKEKAGNAGFTADIREDGLTIESYGAGAHAMQPWVGKNALLPLVQFLKNITELDEEQHQLLEDVDAIFGGSWKGERIGISCEDQISGSLSINPAVFRLTASQMELRTDVRAPLHTDLNVIWKSIQLKCQKYGFDTELLQMKKALYVPADAYIVEELLDVYGEFSGKKENAIVIGGGTYCRDVENFVSYGPVFPGEQELAHETNEYITLDNLMTCARIYTQALYRLLK